MAFPDKITNREYKLAGCFFLIVGGLLSAVALQLGVKDREPLSILLSVFSGLMFVSGVTCLITKPIPFVLILGGFSFAGFAFFGILEKGGVNLDRPVNLLFGFAFAGSALGIVIWRFQNRVSKGATQDSSSAETPPDDQPETHDEP